MCLKLRKPTDEEFRAVITDPWIWDRETEDDSPGFECLEDIPDYVDITVGLIDDTPIGLFIAHPFRDAVGIHFMVLRKFKRHARDFLGKAMDGRGKTYCCIAECYPEVINFAKRSGFEAVEYDDRLFMKNGKQYKRLILCHS